MLCTCTLFSNVHILPVAVGLWLQRLDVMRLSSAPQRVIRTELEYKAKISPMLQSTVQNRANKLIGCDLGEYGNASGNPSVRGVNTIHASLSIYKIQSRKGGHSTLSSFAVEWNSVGFIIAIPPAVRDQFWR
jgi:hypothetical protein